MESLAADDLHGAVVAAVESQVEEENCQQIIGGPRGTGEPKIQTEDDVHDTDDDQTYQPGLGFSLHRISLV